jgi:hypothetical protein
MAISHSIADANVSPNFKTKYPSYMITAYDKREKVLQLIKRDEDLGGDAQQPGLNLSYAAGASTGGPASPTRGKQASLNYTPKELYCSVRVDVKSLKLSKHDKGAFVELDKLALDNIQRMIARVMAIMFWGNGDGIIGTVNGTAPTDNGDETFTMVFSSFTRAHLHVGMLINFGSSTNNFEIVDITTSSSTVKVKRLEGSVDPAANDSVYLEDSKDTAWLGVKKVADVTVGTTAILGLTTQIGWKPTVTAVSNGEAIDAVLIEQVIDNMTEEYGEMPNLIACSRKQYKKLKALQDSIMTLPLPARSGKFKMGNRVPHFMYDEGELPIIKSSYIDDDRIYILDTNQIVMRTAGKGEFVPNDAGKPWHSEIILGRNSLLIQYYVLGEFVIPPPAVGAITGLGTTVRA